jgi:hypothetical protein
MGEENFSISWLAPMGEKLYICADSLHHVGRGNA